MNVERLRALLVILRFTGTATQVALGGFMAGLSLAGHYERATFCGVLIVLLYHVNAELTSSINRAKAITALMGKFTGPVQGGLLKP